ncbi:MAG: hypothetical protein IJF67_12450 [Clostridia bacterium]|nr:hypothetical protein [Clostridia bacterium]
MEKQQKKSGKDVAARSAQTLSGVTKIARGIATQDYVSVAVGAVEALPIKEIVIFIAVILAIVSIPIMVGFSLPQMLFSWSLSENADLIARNEHGAEMAAYFYELAEQLPEDAAPDVEYLICIQSVLANQDVMSITEQDVEDMIALSYTVDADSGEIINHSPDEIMDAIGFTDAQKNWAQLMYAVMSGQRYSTASE